MEGMARGTGLHSSLAIISSHDGFLSLEDFRMINNAHFLLMTVNIRNWSVCRSLVEHHRRKVFTSSFVRKKRLWSPAYNVSVQWFQMGTGALWTYLRCTTFPVICMRCSYRLYWIPLPVTIENLPSTRAGIMRFSALIKNPDIRQWRKFLWPYSYYRKRRYRENGSPAPSFQFNATPWTHRSRCWP